MKNERPKVVIVDDCLDSLHLLRRAFQADGRFEVAGEGETGADAVNLSGNVRPAVIVIDLNMPVMDGFAAIPEIHRVAPHTRIVAMSSFDAFADQVAGLQVDAFCVKDRLFQDAVMMAATVAAIPRSRSVI